MTRLSSLAVLTALLLSATLPAYGQNATADAQAARKERIRENLLFLFPKLAEYKVEMGALETSGITGVDQGSFTVNGQQVQNFLVTEDDQQLYLLAAGPFDVSKTKEDLAQAQKEQAAAAADEAKARRAVLDQAIADAPMRGNPEAPVTIVEFSDFQCPYCARGFGTMEEMLEKHGQDVRLVYLHFPLPNHPWAKPAAIAAVCATDQDPAAFWALHDGFFENQDAINPDNVLDKSKTFLAETGIDLSAWQTCAGDTTSAAHQAATAKVEDAVALGGRVGVSSTPSFFINGRLVSGAHPLEMFESIVEEAKQDID